MAYPNLNIKSIIDRCHDDIKRFLILFPKNDIENFSDKFVLFENIRDYSININNYINIFEKLTNNDLTDFTDFNYGNITLFNENIQMKIWIWRTYLFYQIMIYVILLLSDEQLFKKFNNRKFRKDVSDELENFKICIFGSIKPTSDIDVGIHYSGNTVNGIAYIISVIEDSFIKFLNINCIMLDIEFYSDILTVYEEESNSHVFFLDMTKFTFKNLELLMPYIGMGILRNYIKAIKSFTVTDNNTIIEITDTTDITIEKSDDEDEKSDDEIDKSDEDDKSDEVNDDDEIITKSDNETEFINYQIKKINNFNFDNLFDKYITDMNPLLKKVLHNKIWQNKAKILARDYVNKNYDEMRELYYVHLERTEKNLLKLKKKLINNSYSKSSEIFSDIFKVVYLLSKAEVYREENYICSPTVIHIVKILQENKNKYKYDTLECNFPFVYPQCSIGNIGYYISMIEQIGYIYRYDLLSYKFDKYKIKKNKYIIRFNDAVGKIL